MKNESYADSDEIEEMPDESRNDVLDMLERMQRQLTFLEKKLDMLLNRQETERPFENARPAHRPHRKPYDRQFQQFDRPPRHSRNDGDDRERSYRNRENSRDNYQERRKTTKKPGGKPVRGGFGKKPFYSRYSD